MGLQVLLFYGMIKDESIGQSLDYMSRTLSASQNDNILQIFPKCASGFVGWKEG